MPRLRPGAPSGGPAAPTGPVLRRDPDRPRAWTLLVDGAEQSHVDLDDPRWLEFEYVRRIGHVLDLAAPAGAPLAVLHLGAGALTLARYLAATRPGSTQRAVDSDADLVALVRRDLPLPPGTRLRVQIGDARAVVADRRPASRDVVVSDVFGAARVPARCTTLEYVRELARVLRPGGVAVLNVCDGPPLAWARSEAATVAAGFAHVAVLAPAAVLRGRRFGNLVLVGSGRPLPLAALQRRLAADPAPGSVLVGADLDRFRAGAVVLRDATAGDSPAPPRLPLTRSGRDG
jgi:spermidine synthase